MDATIEALVGRLRDRSAELTARVVAEMWLNPFWQERYGARGQRYSTEDGQHHIAYLIEALIAADVNVLAGYARWLQTVLVSRGMCSLHLAENFDRLAAAIADDEHAAPAVAMLKAATEALRHPSGPGGALQARTPVLVEAVMARLDERLTAVDRERPDPTRCEHVAYHLAYLADALALGRAELFVAYELWLRGFLFRRGIPLVHLDTALGALDEALAADPELADDVRTAARAVVAEAVTRLAGGDPDGPDRGHEPSLGRPSGEVGA